MHLRDAETLRYLGLGEAFFESHCEDAAFALGEFTDQRGDRQVIIDALDWLIEQP